ncbi:MAG: response regulator [Myxococcota bacterium]
MGEQPVEVEIPQPGRGTVLANAFIDRWVPRPIRQKGGDRLRRMRLAVCISMIGLGVTPLMAIALLLSGRRWTGTTLLLSTLGCALSLWLIRTRGWAAVAGHIISTLLYLGTFAAEGLYDPTILGAIGFPVFVIFMAGRRAGWAWCSLSVVNFLWQGSITEGDAAANQAWIIGLVLLTVALTAVAHAFETLCKGSFAEQAQARWEAQAAAEAKTRFLANMSHEIRTPMNGVLGMLGILLDSRLSSDQRSYAETAHTSGVALLDLLNDILDFSKIDAGQMALEVATFDLRGLVEEVLDQLAFPAGDKDLELVTRYAPQTPTHVMGDDGRIRQILLNLVSNAIKFTESGHVQVTVQHTPQPSGPPRFRCSVEDTGIGIPPDKQAAVFDAFQQVDGSTTREHRGTGLGLAIVSELVQLMEGELGLRSEVDEGSTFWFDLPLSLAAETPPEISLEPDLAGQRLLVVDDSRACRTALREQLEGWGLKVDECNSGHRALERMLDAASRQQPYALALLDGQMPRMDGLELARAIQRDDAIRGTTLLMLSSITHRPAPEALLSAGIRAHLVKPVRHSDLLAVLATAWARRDDRLTAPINRPGRSTTGEFRDSFRGARVLIAEDNTTNQKVAQRMLRDLGCHVDVAADGQEALELTATVPYDLVFMDVQMPRMDGLEAAARVRERERETGDPTHLPIVAMTAHAMPEDRERCLAAGMDGYLSKPIERRDLVRELRTYILAHGDSKRGPDPQEPELREPAPLPTDTPCDLSWLRANYDPCDEVLYELLQEYLSHAQELLEQMRAAHRDDDAAAYHRSAHALKGASGSIQATPLFERLSGEAGLTPAALPEVERLFAELHEFIDREWGPASNGAGAL